MGQFQSLFLTIANVFIVIGDVVLTLLSYLLHGIQYALFPLWKFLTKPKHRKHGRKKIISFWNKLRYFSFGLFVAIVFICIPFIAITFLTTLPNPVQLKLNLAPQTTNIYDRHGTLLYQIYADQNRVNIPLSQIPKSLQQATIAIEDKTFYNNPGFDPVAILRAFINDLQGKHLQGASTITQQLIKSALLTPERSIARKIEEVVLASWAERLYSKDQILAMYLNQVPYGGSAWGVESAAETYFGKHVWDLDLAECAFLAGLPQAPTTYSPFGSTPNAWKERQKEVLSHMVTEHFITQKQADGASAEVLSFVNQRIPLAAPHFVFYVKDLLESYLGQAIVEKGGLNVVTTLDLPLQQQVQQIVATEVQNDQYLNLTNGAAMVVNPHTGEILAMVGSRGYNSAPDGNVNVTTAIRQPGSSIKIVTYAAALAHGFTAATILNDAPVVYNNGSEIYAPVNYDGKFHGNVPLRIALANSFNIPAVKTLDTIGLPTFVAQGRAMGLSHLKDASQYGLSATLGGVDTTMVDMMTAYTTLANTGKRVPLTPIMKVTDRNGQVLMTANPGAQPQVVDPGIAYILTSILSDNQARSWEFGTNSPLFIPGHTVAVKTGTTDDKRDNWTFGYTPSFVAGVWVGNNDNSPMSQTLASGITGAAPIWNKIMTLLLGDSPDQTYPVPSDVISKPCLGKTEYFIQGTENSVNCTPLPTWTPTPTPVK